MSSFLFTPSFFICSFFHPKNLPHSSKGPHFTIYYWNANLSLAIRVNILYIEVIRHFVYDILASVCSLHTDHNIDVIVCGNYQLTLNHCMLLLAYWFCKLCMKIIKVHVEIHHSGYLLPDEKIIHPLLLFFYLYFFKTLYKLIFFYRRKEYLVGRMAAIIQNIDQLEQLHLLLMILNPVLTTMSLLSKARNLKTCNL